MKILALLPALFLAPALALAPGPAAARCAGQDLLAQLPATDAAALEAATEAQPFARGNLWQASRADGARLVILGTYHMADPRHDAILARIKIGRAHV